MSLSNSLTEGAPPVLHRSSWVVPVSGVPFGNGCVLVQGDRILAIGPYRAIRGAVPAGTIEKDHGHAAIIPALVNAHTHLELSCLLGKIPLPSDGFPAWVTTLMQMRAAVSTEEISDGISMGKRMLRDGGAWLHGDVTNEARLAETVVREVGTLERSRDEALQAGHVFLELLGFNRETIEEALPPETFRLLLDSGGPALSLAAHSCYSVSAELIRAAHGWSVSKQTTFSIHAAEHPEEEEFLSTGAGFCRRLLEQLGRWVQGWTPPGKSTIQFLDGLGVIGKGSLLVHCVHLDAMDWDTVASRHASVCLCPRSNRNLGVGRADPLRAIERGVTVALGTDSLAGNNDLNLFAEAALLLSEHPSVSPMQALSMATIGGAEALGYAAHYGSIDPGKASALIAVTLHGEIEGHDMIEMVINRGAEGAWRWACTPNGN